MISQRRKEIHIYAVKYYLSMIFYDSLEKYNVLPKRCIKNIALYIHFNCFYRFRMCCKI